MNPQLIFFLNQSLQYLRSGNFQSAELLLRQAQKFAPKEPEVLRLMGIIKFNSGNYEESISFFKKALKLAPRNGVIFSNMGNVLFELKRYEEALAAHSTAISLTPTYAEAYSNMGNVLFELKRYEEALAAHSTAISLTPTYAEAYSNMGNVLFELKRYEEALAAHSTAISLTPTYAEAYSNMGNVLFELKRYGEATSALTNALDFNPNLPHILGRLALSKLHASDWLGLDDLTALISEKILQSKNISAPFDLLPILDNSDLIKKSTEIWCQSKYPDNLCYPKSPKVNRNKIRVGYFSSDFYNHATTHLMAEFFELHNKDKFELIAFSFGPNIEDHSRERLKKAFDQFNDISEMTDEVAVDLIQSQELDIAVDLKGHTQHARTNLFSRRLAPIQVGYLGYPGTIGAPFLDYIVADPILIPESSKDFYSEKIIYLPNSYQVNDAKRLMSIGVPSRSEVGLPESGFVFCCFNSNYKITPLVFDSWSRILQSVEGSVLWLMTCNSTAKENLLKEAEARGIPRSRLVFAEHLKPEDHLARHHLADLFLDTSPCNAHTTASDALLAGLPLLTVLGETFAGRVAASLLNAVGLPELIAKDRDEYESMAIKFATNPEQLKTLRERLETNRLSSPLFDTELTTRHIESAYSIIYDRHLSDLAPEHIYVPNNSA